MSTATSLSLLETKKSKLQNKLKQAQSLCSLLKQDLLDVDIEIKAIKDSNEASMTNELKRNGLSVQANRQLSSSLISSAKKLSKSYERPAENEMGSILVEANTKIRIFDYNLDHADLFDLFNGRKIFSIKDVTNHQGDILNETDSVVIGVIYHKSKIIQSKQGKAVVCILLTDLNGHQIRLFCAEKALNINNEPVGSVVALLNPDVVKPSESLGAMGLALKSSDRVLLLGKSADLSFCSNSECQRIINAGTSKINICSNHRDQLYKRAKLQRQELAVGTAKYQVGPPVASGTASTSRDVEKYATYNVFSEFIVSEGFRFSVREPLKPTVQSVDKEKIEAMANMHGRGADVIRKSLGIEKNPMPCNRNFF